MDKSLARCAYLLKANSAVGQITLSTLGLLLKLTIIGNLYLLCAFHKRFLFPYFLYLQKGDAQAVRTASFIACNCVVCYYLMVTQLHNSLRNNKWKEQNEYKDVVSAVRNCGKDKMKVFQEKRSYSSFKLLS